MKFHTTSLEGACSETVHVLSYCPERHQAFLDKLLELLKSAAPTAGICAEASQNGCDVPASLAEFTLSNTVLPAAWCARFRATARASCRHSSATRLRRKTRVASVFRKKYAEITFAMRPACHSQRPRRRILDSTRYGRPPCDRHGRTPGRSRGTGPAPTARRDAVRCRTPGAAVQCRR